MSKLKQVIVLRKDLNMRKGKMVAQGCHASLGAYLRSIERIDDHAVNAYSWLKNQQTKICVGVDSEEELLKIHHLSVLAHLPNYLVLDAAHTEFDKPTLTCCAIGPAESEKIDKITGGLKLL